MGYLDKTTKTVDAVLTTHGRQIMARAISGKSLLHANEETEELIPEYVITKFTLFDDEIDYGLWDENQDPNLKGRVIENQPLLEPILSNVNMDPGGGMYKYTLKDAPPVYLTNLPGGITLNGHNDNKDIIPQTNNSEEAEEYEFFLGLDNVLDMRQPWHAPQNPPTNLVATVIGEGNSKTIQLDFNAPDGFIPATEDEYYNVYIDNQKVTNYPQSYTATSFTFPIDYYANLNYGTTYGFYVAARNKDGEGPPSEIVTLDIPSIPGMVSEIEAGITQQESNLNNRTLTINWTAPPISEGWMAMPGTYDNNLEGRNHYRLYLDGQRISGVPIDYGNPSFTLPFNNTNWIGEGGATVDSLGTPTGQHTFEISTYNAPADMESNLAALTFTIPILPSAPTNLMLDLDHPNNVQDWFRFKWDRPAGFTPGYVGGSGDNVSTNTSGYIVYKDGVAISGIGIPEYFAAPYDWGLNQPFAGLQPFTIGETYDFQVAVKIGMLGLQGSDTGYGGISNIGDLESEKSEVFSFHYTPPPLSGQARFYFHITPRTSFGPGKLVEFYDHTTGEKLNEITTRGDPPYGLYPALPDPYIVELNLTLDEVLTKTVRMDVDYSGLPAWYKHKIDDDGQEYTGEAEIKLLDKDQNVLMEFSEDRGTHRYSGPIKEKFGHRVTTWDIPGTDEYFTMWTIKPNDTTIQPWMSLLWAGSDLVINIPYGVLEDNFVT